IEADGSIRPNRGGDIWTKQQYGDFILDMEFKVAENANSGIFLRCDDISNWLDRSIEVQVLDSCGKEVDKHVCGAIFDVFEPATNAVKPAGEWNHITIICLGGKIGVILNDKPVINMDLDNWMQARQNPDGTKNKFKYAYKDMPRRGHIGLQDHGDYAWYRHIRVKPVYGEGQMGTIKPQWRLGVQCWTFHKFSFCEALDKISSLGLKYVEAFPGHLLGPEFPGMFLNENLPIDVRQQIKVRLKQKGLALVNYGVVGLSNDEAQCRKIFEFARDMGIETLVAEPSEDAFDLLEKLCDEYNINLAIHNHPKPTHYWNPQTALKICQGRSKRIGICADTGHWVRSGLDPVQCLREAEGRIKVLHFKEIDQGHDVVWGTAQNRARPMLKELDRQKFSGVFSIEYEYNWENSLPEIRECIENFYKIAAEMNSGS
ncbi:MAG: DUF1080 domain-containing protein, partial [Sedimentisphaerales bacterium]|nr:DUF1080 domain-containing protein [Sedimentisphaerales bacterium]